MVGIISDIHGNFVALSAVLSSLDIMGVSKIVCLGDVGGYYCQINECCEELQRRNVFSLMGNHDWYLVTGEECPRSNSANVCLDFQRGKISVSNKRWLASLNPIAQRGDLYLVHGGWHDPLDEYISPSLDYFTHLEGNFFVSGHTHVPCVWKEDNKAYCNPGSVGQPRDGDSRAAFAIWDGETFFIQRVEYDIYSIQHQMALAGFSPYYYDNLSRGTRIGGGISTM